MNKTIILVGESQKSHAVQTIASVEIDPENLICVTFEPYSKVKSRQQEKLYWMRLGHIAKMIAFETPIYENDILVRTAVLHKDKDWWHSYLALKFLEPVWIMNPNTGEEIPIPRSTKKLKRKEYSEYMEKIVGFAADFKIVLPDPVDEYYE